MKKHLLILFLMGLAGIVYSDTGSEMTGEQIRARCLEAMTGEAENVRLKTIRLGVLYPGHDYTVTTEFKSPDQFSNTGKDYRIIYNNRNAWMIQS